MRGVVQRVLSAKAVIDGETVGEIGQGLLVLVCA
ncbi:MAG: D-aminoacyl-tRNA deacylase, partial [Burkholderiaceae bacterium]|nr:D-aminoacyl-tRNA deacylase [Burkholderiaceae bacterium]